MKVVFSQSSIFHLYRLGSVVAGKTGRKYRLSNDAEMQALIRFCDRSKDPNIAQQFDAFIGSVDQQILEEMQEDLMIRRSPPSVH